MHGSYVSDIFMERIEKRPNIVLLRLQQIRFVCFQGPVEPDLEVGGQAMLPAILQMTPLWVRFDQVFVFTKVVSFSS